MDVDNSRLKEMMVKEPDERTEEEDEEFFEEFKESTLLVLMDENNDLFTIKIENRDYIVPIFTDFEEVDKITNLDDKTKKVWMRTDFLSERLIELPKVKEIIINPTSQHAIGMSFETFLAIFRDEKIKELEEIIRQEGQRLAEDSRFYLRESEPFMKQESVDGIFTSQTPFPADFIDNFNPDLEYLNILLIPKGTRFLVVGQSDKVNDTLFAPVIKFKLIEENDKIYTWQCISQELNYKIFKINLFYLILAIIIIVVVVAFIFLI